MMQQFVPVVSSKGKRLMPTSNRKADKLVASGRALRRFDRGLFYIQLTDREDGYTQPIVVGIDPGSKKEAITVKSTSATYLNIQADAVSWVQEQVATRREMRRGRRSRKTRYRKMRVNRGQLKSQQRIPPSTKARWQWKLRLCNWLARYYPIITFAIEDIKAKTRPGKKLWNATFSPLEVGKQWFYGELGKLAKVLCYVGGTLNGRLSLHSLEDGKRLCQRAKAEACQLITLSSWRIRKGTSASS